MPKSKTRPRAKPEASVEVLLKRCIGTESIFEAQKLPDRRGYRVRIYGFGARQADVDGRTLRAALKAALAAKGGGRKGAKR